MKNKTISMISWLASVFVLVLADQYTKQLAVTHLKGKTPYVLWDGVFEFLYSENRGAAFGMMQGKQSFFFLVALVVFVVAAYAMWKMPSWDNRKFWGLRLCTTLITAGAAGNMVDRISLGYVVDFLYFRLIDFPIFNVADIYVTTATAILVLLICFYYKEEDLMCFQWNSRAKKGELD